METMLTKRYRDLQLACFMHYCVQSCWKYDSGVDKSCRHFFPYDVCSLCTSIVTTHSKRNNRKRTRVLPPRNNANLQTAITSSLYHIV